MPGSSCLCRYDFFIVSQAVRSGSVSPTHYNVIYDSSGLKPDHIQRLTYKLCHVYYNWPVSVRVPTVEHLPWLGCCGRDLGSSTQASPVTGPLPHRESSESLHLASMHTSWPSSWARASTESRTSPCPTASTTSNQQRGPACWLPSELCQSFSSVFHRMML